jgi:hypothetical protein
VLQQRWQLVWASGLFASGLCFVCGFGWPLLKATLFGQNIVP